MGVSGDGQSHQVSDSERDTDLFPIPSLHWARAGTQAEQIKGDRRVKGGTSGGKGREHGLQQRQGLGCSSHECF